jgi:redox-sensitive bicupin YhaK (pirin superfamily)
MRMEPGAHWVLAAAPPKAERTFYYFAGDTLTVSGDELTAGVGFRLAAERAVEFVTGRKESELLLLQGRPIGEPIVQHGPFVMNTRDEIEQAISDYRNTGFGGWPFERNDPVHARDRGRFAVHADGRTEEGA